jgi:hypothetical protein
VLELAQMSTRAGEGRTTAARSIIRMDAGAMMVRWAGHVNAGWKRKKERMTKRVKKMPAGGQRGRGGGDGD